MKESTRYIRYPDGEHQEILSRLQVNQLVDINGRPLHLPLPTVKMIVYRVFRISTLEDRNETALIFHLEQLNIHEMEELL